MGNKHHTQSTIACLNVTSIILKRPNVFTHADYYYLRFVVLVVVLGVGEGFS